MVARKFEIRDAVHGFVELDEFDRAVLDSRPLQRLRHVHQLALSYLVYPGASHKRFEHSLGVMELAGRIFDTVTRPDKLDETVADIVPERGSLKYAYWRSVLRMAALCHDIGHLPFSHAAESDLLPPGFDHERLTCEIIHSSEMLEVWSSMEPEPKPEHIAKLALGPRAVEKLRLDFSFNTWEAILADMISGDFGADRVDYLLRDSLHTGVAYGRFDHHRLIQTLRIMQMPSSPRDEVEQTGDRPEAALGIERGGLESAEALMLARYLMFSQVYYHHTRLIYDAHLKDFLAVWLSKHRFSVVVEDHLRMTDNEVTAALLAAERDDSAVGHDPARRILKREHFRVAYARKADDVGERAHATRAIYDAAVDRYGAEHVRYGASPKRPDPPDFPVRERDGSSASSLALSEVFSRLPAARDEYVFIAPEKRREAQRWIRDHREEIIENALARDEEVAK